MLTPWLLHYCTLVVYDLDDWYRDQSATTPAQQPKSDAKSLIKAVTTWLRAKFG